MASSSSSAFPFGFSSGPTLSIPPKVSRRKSDTVSSSSTFFIGVSAIHTLAANISTPRSDRSSSSSSRSDPSSSSTVSTSAIVIPNASPQLSLKLTATNYLEWRAQYLPILIGSDLVHFVDGSLPCPQRTPQSTPNEILAASAWNKQDQIILSWLISSLSEDIVPEVVSAKTSREAWTRLEQIFEPYSISRLLDLKHRLFHISMGDGSIADYILSVRSIAEYIAAIDKPLSDEDLVSPTLRGLGPQYKKFATSVRLRTEPVSFEELVAMLFNHEVFLRSLGPAPASSVQGFPSVPASLVQNAPSAAVSKNSGPRWRRGRGYSGRSNQRILSQHYFAIFAAVYVMILLSVQTFYGVHAYYKH